MKNNVIWIIMIIVGMIYIQFGKPKSVFIIASIMMIIFAGVMLLFDDLNEYFRIDKYKKYIEKIDKNSNGSSREKC